jgi:type I restriction enzyme S subunit
MKNNVNWKSLTLGEVCALRGGSAFSPSLQGREAGDLPFIKVRDFNSPQNSIYINAADHWVAVEDASKIQGKPFDEGTSVFAKIGEALKHNRVRFLTRRTYIDNNLMGATAKKGVIEPEFLFHVLRTLDFAASNSGTSVPYITASALAQTPVLVPARHIQNRIAQILGAYDRLLEVNRQRIGLLEEVKRRLFEEWFVHFRFPGNEGRVTNDDLPEGWKRVPIEQVYEGLYDGPHATPKPSTNGPVFLGIGNITESGQLDLSSVRHISETEFPNWTRRVTPRPGDIVFTYEATLNRYAMIPRDFRGCLGRRLALIRTEQGSVYRNFLFLYFFSADWRETITRNILSGATVERIPLSKLPTFPINLPPQAIAAKFDRIVQPIFDHVEGIRRSNIVLRTQRDMLLPRLISGKLPLLTAERELEAVA